MGGRALQEFILQGACPKGVCPPGSVLSRSVPSSSVPSGESALRGRARSAGRWVGGREGGPEAAVMAPVGEIQAQSHGAPLGGSLSGTGHAGLLHPAGLAALGLSPHAGGPHSPWPVPAVSAPIPSCR